MQTCCLSSLDYHACHSLIILANMEGRGGPRPAGRHAMGKASEQAQPCKYQGATIRPIPCLATATTLWQCGRQCGTTCSNSPNDHPRCTGHLRRHPHLPNQLQHALGLGQRCSFKDQCFVMQSVNKVISDRQQTQANNHRRRLFIVNRLFSPPTSYKALCFDSC